VIVDGIHLAYDIEKKGIVRERKNVPFTVVTGCIVETFEETFDPAIRTSENNAWILTLISFVFVVMNKCY